MKSRKFIFRWLLFTVVVCCCSVFVKLSFNRETPSLEEANVEALASSEDDFHEVIKYCEEGNGWCIYNDTEFYGLVFIEK